MTATLLLQAADAAAPGWRAVLEWLNAHERIAQLLAVLLVIVLAYIADLVANRILLATIGRIVRRTATEWDDVLLRNRVFQRLAHLAPAVAVYYGITLVPGVRESFATFIQQATVASMVLIGALVASALLSAINDLYSASSISSGRPIKGYVQVIKIVVFLVAAIVALAALTGRSPLLLLSGIGAMTAVLLLVFRDTILSFVASLLIASYDMMRVGDWIEMPQYGADGDVVDIGLHTIKVQNWDKTITAIPTHKFLTDSFKNWRSMSESGGRRIKRAVNVDMNSIRFLQDSDIERFERFVLLRDYIRAKKKDLAAYNAQHAGDPSLVANARKLTNIGTFRVYIAQYLRDHPKIHKGMTLMVRQLSPTPNGLPLEIYAFSNDINWVAYEGIQADIFDHVLAIAPEFGLRIFQTPSGRDFEAALTTSRSA